MAHNRCAEFPGESLLSLFPVQRRWIRGCRPAELRKIAKAEPAFRIPAGVMVTAMLKRTAVDGVPGEMLNSGVNGVRKGLRWLLRC
jgi:hypothetical protein